jgi:hypothetical protein
MPSSLCVPVQSRIRVPTDYIAAPILEIKMCKSVQGPAGRKRMCILEQQQCNQKKIYSKVGYLEGTMPTNTNKETRAGRLLSLYLPPSLSQSPHFTNLKINSMYCSCDLIRHQHKCRGNSAILKKNPVCIAGTFSWPSRASTSSILW